MAIKKVTAPAAAGVNFGDLATYVGGGGIPEGNYALGFEVMMHQAEKDGVAKGPNLLGVMITAHPLGGGEAKQKFYSMGSKAHESFAPNPDTGKGIVPIAGGAGNTLNDQTNWAYFMKSLYDSQLPPGIFTNDISVLDGVWVHIGTIPEPESRKSFVSSRTAEVGEEPRRNQTISVVTEILPNGEPWANGGGIPEAGKAVAAAPKSAAGKVAPKAQATAAPAAAASTDVSEEDLMEAAQTAATSVLETNPEGVGKLVLKTQTFKAAQKSFGEEIAQSIMATFFSDDASINTVLEPLGFVIKGLKAVPA